MIQVNEIAFVAYPVTDKPRAGAFYEGLLGSKPAMDSELPGGYWVEYEVGAGTLALSNYWKPAAQTSMGPAAAIEVQNFDDTLALLKSKGIPIVDGPHESTVCFMAMVTDPDGNSLWIHKRKPERGEFRGLEIPFVCYPVTDRQRACDFYGSLLGLKETSQHTAPDGFWLEYDIGEGTLALCSYWKPSAEPSMGPSIAFEVENFDTAIAELKAKGVPFAMEPLDTPVCNMAVVTDPDGNSLFIHKRKPNPGS
jgi:catechol 2,3-dioxygenase-like lactoylglutathione lyase family enzyme